MSFYPGFFLPHFLCFFLPSLWCCLSGSILTFRLLLPAIAEKSPFGVLFTKNPCGGPRPWQLFSAPELPGNRPQWAGLRTTLLPMTIFSWGTLLPLPLCKSCAGHRDMPHPQGALAGDTDREAACREHRWAVIISSTHRSTAGAL